MKESIRSLKKFLAVALNAVATEHFFTFSLSSLPTTQKFFSQNESDRNKVREAYIIATVLSMGLAGVSAKIIKDTKPLITTAVLSGIFILLYEKSLIPDKTVGGTEEKKAIEYKEA